MRVPATLFVATYPQQLEQYAIGADGALTALTPAELGLYGCRAVTACTLI